MADISIQRKKAKPNPWLLVILAMIILALAAFFFLRPDPTDEPAPTTTSTGLAPTDSLAPGSDAADARATPPPADGAPGTAEPIAQAETTIEENENKPAALTDHVATSPAAPDYARRGLQLLTAALVDLADRADLRDPGILEQRDNLTSATNRLNEANTSLRPGFVAAASVIRAMQQKGYPNLETTANELVQQAGQLSGRSASAAEQEQNQQFLTQAAAAVRALNEPAR